MNNEGLMYVKSLADYAVDFAQSNNLDLTADEISDAVTGVAQYTKSFLNDALLENAVARAERDKELVKQALMKYFTQVDEEENLRMQKSDSPAEPSDEVLALAEQLKAVPVEKASTDDILTLHPLHLYAHVLDESGEGFDWSKCPADVIDPEFCPPEVVAELNRRHGLNYYPHTHVDGNDSNSKLIYHRAAVNQLKEGFSELHERVHRVDYSNFVKGSDRMNPVVHALQNGSNRDYSGGEIDPSLIQHIVATHGDNWDGHPMEVPLIKAEYSSNGDEAMLGANWGVAYQKMAPAVIAAAARVAGPAARVIGTAAKSPAVQRVAAAVAPHLKEVAMHMAGSAGAAAGTTAVNRIADRLEKKKDGEVAVRKSHQDEASELTDRIEELVMKAKGGHLSEDEVSELQELVEKAEDFAPQHEPVEHEAQEDNDQPEEPKFAKASSAPTRHRGTNYDLVQGVYRVGNFDTVGALLQNLKRNG